MLSPAMQGVILAIAKARQTFDRDGSEAGLVKVFYLFAKLSSMEISFHRMKNLLHLKTYQESERKYLCFFFPSN